MAEFEVNTGYDTWVNETSPTQNNALGRRPALRSGDELRILLFMPLASTRIGGKTILSATLSVAVHNNWVDQVVTAQAISAEWDVDTVTYADQPGVVGATASSASTGALSAGDRFEIDVTALVQAIANGQANYGWRLTTSQTTTYSTVRGFDSGYASWTLTVEVSDLPDAPSQLSPAGVIATGTPVVTIDEVDDIAQMQVQIDATPSGTNADYDTGWVSVTTPQLDLSDTFPDGTAGGVADTTYNGLADGATTYWRARSKLVDSSASDWSDWVEIERDDQPSLVDDTGTTIYDPTPTFEAHLSPAGDADTRWQVIIRDVGDPTAVRYNSGNAIAGAALAHEVPLMWNGQKVFPTDGTYVRVIKAWDRSDRVATEGVPTYVRLVDTITLDTQAAVVVPASVTAVQDGTTPVVTIGWTCAGTPVRFGIFNSDGEIVAMVDADDVEVSAGVFEYDYVTATPNKADTYTVRAVADNAGVMSQSVDSTASASLTPSVAGVWLRSDTASVMLRAGTMDARQVDKRQPYDLPYRGESVDIVTAVGGLEGTYQDGMLRAPSASTLAQLETWRQSSERLRVVWGTHNILADVKGLSVVWDPRTASEQLYKVSFGFAQVAETS